MLDAQNGDGRRSLGRERLQKDDQVGILRIIWKLLRYIKIQAEVTL
jgi:hypothetical protein